MQSDWKLTRRDFVGSLAAVGCSCVVGTIHAQGRGKKYAVVVGVEDYDPEELNPLRYTERDAEALAAELTRLQFDVTLMTAKSNRPQLKPNSAEKIERVLSSRSTGLSSDDTLIFAFMGHGVQFAADKVGEVQELYFCPEDARLADRSTLLSMDNVYQTLGASTAGRKLLLVDACRNDPQPKGRNRGKETELESVGRAIRTVPQGMLALFSCSEGETSREYPDLDMGHGVFTYHVLKYLRGQADSNWYPQQQLTVADLAHYVSRETKDFVWNKENKDQIPIPYGKVAPWSLGSAPSRQLAKTFRSKSTGMEFVLIPAGTFMMGSPTGEEERSDSETQHQVTLSRDFYLGKYEVTQGEFDRAMGFNPSNFTESDRLPVERVSWFDAVWFCNQLSDMDGREPCYRISSVEKDGNSVKSARVELLHRKNGYRLPTEAEWEYACRGGTTDPFSFGDTISTDQVNCDGNRSYAGSEVGAYRERTVPVDSLPYQNGFGLFHVHGNVWEWCWDTQSDYSANSVIDPVSFDGSLSRVYRGGSWFSHAGRCRSAVRDFIPPQYHDFSIGFRVALGL